MKKLTIILFLMTAGLLTYFYFAQTDVEVEEKQENIIYTKAVIPVEYELTDEGYSSNSEQQENSTFLSYIQLLPDETLLQTYEVVLSEHSSRDQMSDQISAVKKAGHENIFLIIGIYDVTTDVYIRSAEIETKISKFSTFTLTFTDLIGNHMNAVIYSGFSDANRTVLGAYQPQEKDGVFSIQQIAELTTEGTFSIQEPQRSDAYLMGQDSGESYQIWEYSPDPDSGKNSLDQIQIVYSWNPNLYCYERISSRKITGKQISSQELAKILDGTKETFSNFLSGTWYKTTVTDEQRYIFFNPEDKEIICFTDGTQEVFSWNSDWMRRYGLSMATKNISIAAVSRQFDTTIIATDEIKVTATDDLGTMIIGEESLWDGNYKKMKRSLSSSSDQEKPEIDSFLTSSENPWVIQDEYSMTFLGSSWTVENGTSIVCGIFVTSKVFDSEVIEFRSNAENVILNGCYTARKDTESRQNKDILILQPVDITVSGLVQNGSQINLERKK